MLQHSCQNEEFIGEIHLNCIISHVDILSRIIYYTTQLMTNSA